MNMHGKRIHDKNIEKFPCPHCMKLFTKMNMKRHIQTVHTIDRSFKCETCVKSFKTKMALQRHNRSHNDTRDFLCEFCGTAFKRSSTKNKHIKNMHDNNNIVYTCKYCNDHTSYYKTTINNHENRHETNLFKQNLEERLNNSDFPCVYCDIDFNNENDRKVHSDAIHAKDLPYACGYCSIRFKYEVYYKQHLNSHIKNIKMNSLMNYHLNVNTVR
jgi:uncharacterized Zn-finger protein